MALTSDGQIFTWGSNQHGQLGLDSADALPSGTHRVLNPQVVRLPGVRFIDVRAGGYHTAALTEDGRLFTLGRNDDGQLGLGDTLTRRAPTLVPSGVKFKSIAACLRHTLVLRSALAMIIIVVQPDLQSW